MHLGLIFTVTEVKGLVSYIVTLAPDNSMTPGKVLNVFSLGVPSNIIWHLKVLILSKFLLLLLLSLPLLE